ncbi:MAG: S4 domain-containing protein [Pseudomonadales bacterium]
MARTGQGDDGPTQRVRLDRWLWAARFYRTRAQAKAAIEGGKISIQVGSTAHRPKVSRELGLGDRLTIRRGWTPEEVVVTGLSEQRGDAASARTLYQETPESIETRAAATAERRMLRAGLQVPATRPSKRDRRELQRLKQTPEEES